MVELSLSFNQLPIYAECGGMLLLGQTIADINGKVLPMAGILPFHSRKGKLKVGYRNLNVTRDSLLLRAGESLIGHEFHQWELSD